MKGALFYTDFAPAAAWIISKGGVIVRETAHDLPGMGRRQK
jgi:hypothetical protein